MRLHRLPLTLRLPFAMADRHLRLEQILAADSSRPWADCLPLLSCFSLSRPEQRFARRVLQRKRNVWLFRCNQRAFCGDFITVDMSSRRADQRLLSVIELKSRPGISLNGRGAGNQLQNARAAVRELAQTTRVVSPDTRVTLACGDAEGVLRWLEH